MGRVKEVEEPRIAVKEFGNPKKPADCSPAFLHSNCQVVCRSDRWSEVVCETLAHERAKARGIGRSGTLLIVIEIRVNIVSLFLPR
jgi:hypothetical protein